MEEVGGVVDNVLYGGKNAPKAGQGFGTALYEIKEEKRKGCTYTAEVATFYKDYVVLRNAVQKGCLPMRYEETVMPKYRMCGAVITRGANNFLLMIGLIMLVILTNLERMGAVFLIGVFLALIGAALLATPLCLTYYVCELQVLCDPDDPASPKCGYTSYYLRTFKKPDDDFILLYVRLAQLEHGGLPLAFAPHRRLPRRQGQAAHDDLDPDRRRGDARLRPPSTNRRRRGRQAAARLALEQLGFRQAALRPRAGGRPLRRGGRTLQEDSTHQVCRARRLLRAPPRRAERAQDPLLPP